MLHYDSMRALRTSKASNIWWTRQRGAQTESRTTHIYIFTVISDSRTRSTVKKLTIANSSTCPEGGAIPLGEQVKHVGLGRRYGRLHNRRGQRTRGNCVGGRRNGQDRCRGSRTNGLWFRLTRRRRRVAQPAVTWTCLRLVLRDEPDCVRRDGRNGARSKVLWALPCREVGTEGTVSSWDGSLAGEPLSGEVRVSGRVR